MNTPRQSLKSMRDALQGRWQALAPREKTLVRVAAWLAGLALLVLVGIRPALQTTATAPARIREVQSVLDQMNRLAEETRSLRQVAPVSAAASEAALRAGTERLGAAAKLSVQADRVTVTFDKVDGARLAEWLVEVRVGARARPLEAKLAQAEAGQYSGTVVLALSSSPAAR